MTIGNCRMDTDARGRELTEHGTALFPAACYQNELTMDAVSWHWHDEMEALIVVKGQILAAVGAEKYTVKEGQGLFINAGVLHALWAAGDSDSRICSIVFHPRLVGGSVDSVFWQNYVQPHLNKEAMKSWWLDKSSTWHEEAIRFIDTAWRSAAGELPGFEIETRYALSRLLFLLSGHCSPGKKRPSEKMLRDGDRIKIMLDFIQENYGENISTAQIAGKAMISESECLRCFRSTIGTTPIQYVKQFRIQKAAELLDETDWKIAEIGALCGFQEMSYFAKSFREIRGCTPTEYRQRKGMAETGIPSVRFTAERAIPHFKCIEH